MAVPPSVAIPVEAIKGRGAATRMAHRFAKDARDGFDDGWGGLDEAAGQAGAAVPTELIWEDARSAISRNQSPDCPFALLLWAHISSQSALLRASNALKEAATQLNFEVETPAANRSFMRSPPTWCWNKSTPAGPCSLDSLRR